jgi:adenosylmethionine-8-amino-7-oxononanoate aminotransferase
MGAVFAAPRVHEPFFRPDAGVWWRHGYTYSGHATAAAVALANLDIIERDGLLDEALRLEATLSSALAPLTSHDSVVDVRSGTGALAAVQLSDGPAAMALAKKLRSHGVATRAVGAGGIQISPAFVMTDEQVGDLAGAISDALDG